MSRRVSIKARRAAREKLESAIETLLCRAQNYTGLDDYNKTQYLLGAAREYGRALQRVERVGRGG